MYVYCTLFLSYAVTATPAGVSSRPPPCHRAIVFDQNSNWQPGLQMCHVLQCPYLANTVHPEENTPPGQTL